MRRVFLQEKNMDNPPLRLNCLDLTNWLLVRVTDRRMIERFPTMIIIKEAGHSGGISLRVCVYVLLYFFLPVSILVFVKEKNRRKWKEKRY